LNKQEYKMKRRIVSVLLVFLAAMLASQIQAKGREPCSGSKGGVQRCVNGKFLCNDGSISRSKKICNSELYGSRKSGNSSSRGEKK
ncbi:YdcA family protein, partial [Turicimonas muris]